jgi:hypothetical protein
MHETKIFDNTFSVEMKSKLHVKSISISDEARDRVLFEGNLGKMLEVSFVEGDVLEFIGVNGVLRVAITEEQLRKVLNVAYARARAPFSAAALRLMAASSNPILEASMADSLKRALCSSLCSAQCSISFLSLSL